jgi:ABC-type uncharacterized transport system permease subunit
MSSVLPFIAIAAGAALYAASGILFFLAVAQLRPSANDRASIPGIPQNRASILAPRLLAGAVAAHAAYVCIASFVQHVCPVHSVHFLLSVTSVVAGSVYLVVRLKHRIDALGVLLAPLGLAFLLSTFFLGQPAHGASASPAFLATHVLVNLIGVALFVLAGAAAILYLMQERRLKLKRPAGFGLPPLDALDRAEHRFLIAGFPMLTIGVLSGTFWAKQLEFGTPDEVARIVFGYATWLLTGAVLLLRAAAGWRGRRAAYGTIAGLVFAMAVIAVYLTRPAAAPASARDQRAASTITSSVAAPR